MEWILVLGLAGNLYTVPKTYPSEEACHEAGELVVPSCKNVQWGWCRVKTHYCIPQPKDIK